MIAKTKSIQKRIDGLDGRRHRTAGNDLCIWNSALNEGAIVCNDGPDHYFCSLRALKATIVATMSYGDYSPRDCSWACGNEPALAALADMAGLQKWVAAQERKLGIVNND